MPRDPNIPDEFDVYTLVLLRRPKDAPQLREERRDELQSHHLAYSAGLRLDGVLVANGPFGEQSARVNDGDPMVKAGWLDYDLMEWWVAVGDRRVMSHA